MGDEHSGSEGHRDEQSGLKRHEGCGDMSDPTQNNMEGARDEPLGSKPQRGPEVSNQARNAMVGVRRTVGLETIREGGDASDPGRDNTEGARHELLGSKSQSGPEASDVGMGGEWSRSREHHQGGR